MAAQIADRVIDHFKALLPDWVIGSDHAAATLSFEVARQFGVKHDFTQKGSGKSQVWNRFDIHPDETVLQVEELVTTSLTLDEVRKGFVSAMGHLFTFSVRVHTRPSFSSGIDRKFTDLLSSDIMNQT